MERIPQGHLLPNGRHTSSWRGWRNGVFTGRSLRELFQHTSGVVVPTHRVIHDILPDADGRGINLLLEQIGRTRRTNGLWVVAIHRGEYASPTVELPEQLQNRDEAIAAAKIISSSYGNGKDRHAHIIHICPWASNYCRCKPLQGVPIKRRTRPSKPWQYLTVEHFSNLIEYTMLYPRQLCLFEIGGSPVYISLASDKSDGGGARSQETWNALWPAGYQTVCADFPAGEHPMQVLIQAALEMIITEHRSTSNPNEDHKTPQLLSSTACRRTRLPCDLVFLKLTRFSAV